MKTKAKEDNQRFFKIPMGNSRPIQTSKEIKKNPVIHYKEENNDTCAFTSMCSCLHYMKYEDVAFKLDTFKGEFMKSLYFENFYNIMGVVTNFLQKKSYKYFQKAYKVRKIGNYTHFNIIEQGKQFPKVLFHVGLRSSDGAENHAVCICDNWIFDGNFTNTLPLTKANLDLCCDSEFIGIRFGYMYIPNVSM